jgi:hypothetical protein
MAITRHINSAAYLFSILLFLCVFQHSANALTITVEEYPIDAFPNDPTESVDTDGDGFGDNSDPFPADNTNNADGNWIHCANEWRTCNLPAQALVRYGANDTYIFKTATDSIRCTNSAFGNPINIVKSCDYLLSDNNDFDNDGIAESAISTANTVSSGFENISVVRTISH